MKETTCICTSLRLAALEATDRYDAIMAPSGLKVTMFRMLAIAHEAEAPSITELAKALGLDRSTVGRNLKVLERQGYVRLAGGEDERARAVELTDTGLTALSAARPLWEQAQLEMKATLQGASDELLSLLRRIDPKPA